MKTIDIQRAQETFRALWDRKREWEHFPVTDTDPEYWVKEYPTFKVTITNFGGDIFDAALSWGDRTSECFESEKKISNFESMQEFADKLAIEFSKAALLEQDPPSGQVRFKQIAIDRGDIYGLTEEGKVCRKGPEGVWIPLPMMLGEEGEDSEPKYGLRDA